MPDERTIGSRPVYQNPTSRKYYTFDFQDGQNIFYPVFGVTSAVWSSVPFKADKKGRSYKVLGLEPITTKNGFPAFQIYKGNGGFKKPEEPKGEQHDARADQPTAGASGDEEDLIPF